jgi:two-component system sensor histidine kinase KdpD
LLEGLEQLPALLLDVGGAKVREFNLDAALARRPALILVDELAHTNAPGARHPKRWQDIDELLATGIDVFTTLNVQHLESLNDVVGGITGIRVWETVPIRSSTGGRRDPGRRSGRRIARAAQGGQGLRSGRNRARGGKFLSQRQSDGVARACASPHRRSRRRGRAGVSNRTGDRADLEDGGVAVVLRRTRPGRRARRAERGATRAQIGVEWTAVYVETPKLQRMPSIERERILRTVKLAQELGAKTAILSGGDPAAAIVEYAHGHNCSKIVVGRTRRDKTWPWTRLVATRIGDFAPDVDVIEIGEASGALAATCSRRGSGRPGRSAARRQATQLRLDVVACIATTLVASPLHAYFDPANIVMLFLLLVVVIAVRFGRDPLSSRPS